MKRSAIAHSINKITLVALLFSSLVYHVREGLRAKENETCFFKKTLQPSTFFATPFMPTSSLSVVVLPNKNFIKL